MKVIAIDKSYYNLFQSFQNIVSDNERAWYTTIIYWDAPNHTLVGTCGCALLYCNYENLRSFLGDESTCFKYQKGFLTEDEVLKKELFVKYEKVIPNWSNQEYFSFKRGKEKLPAKYYAYNLMSQVSAGTGKVFNPKLFGFVEKIAEEFSTVYHRRGVDPVLLENNTGSLKYVIMPMQLG